MEILLILSHWKSTIRVRSSIEHSFSRQTVYQRGSQREGSPHYVFLYSDDEDDHEKEGIPLEPRNRAKTVPRKVEVIKVSLKPEDTLQALALRYRCTVSNSKNSNSLEKISKDRENVMLGKFLKFSDFRAEKNKQYSQRERDICPPIHQSSGTAVFDIHREFDRLRSAVHEQRRRKVQRAIGHVERRTIEKFDRNAHRWIRLSKPRHQ